MAAAPRADMRGRRPAPAAPRRVAGQALSASRRGGSAAGRPRSRSPRPSAAMPIAKLQRRSKPVDGQRARFRFAAGRRCGRRFGRFFFAGRGTFFRRRGRSGRRVRPVSVRLVSSRSRTWLRRSPRSRCRGSGERDGDKHQCRDQQQRAPDARDARPGRRFACCTWPARGHDVGPSHANLPSMVW